MNLRKLMKLIDIFTHVFGSVLYANLFFFSTFLFQKINTKSAFLLWLNEGFLAMAMSLQNAGLIF